MQQAAYGAGMGGSPAAGTPPSAAPAEQFACRYAPLPAPSAPPHQQEASLNFLLTGRELEGAPFYLITYASLAGFYAVAMHSGNIWVPLQFVGATAGGLGWAGLAPFLPASF